MKYKLLFFILCVVSCLQAQIPAGYYNAACNLKGHALRTALHDIISNHTSIAYSGLWDAFVSTDSRSDGKVWDIYSDIPDGTPRYLYTFVTDQCGNYTSEGDCYNREHAIPKSWFNGQAPMYTDLFHIYPTDGYVNNKRGNFPYGEVGNATWTSTNGSQLGDCITPGCNGTVFEPIDEYKGDLARSFLYMTVCYMDKNLGGESQSMFTGGSLKPWALSLLLAWSREDVVSPKEIERNNAIYALQHNRNPFIDYPELADKIYGSDSVNAFIPTGIVSPDEHPTWTVRPNPASAQICIMPVAPVAKSVICTLRNLAGQTVLTRQIPALSTCRLDVSHLPAGLYLLQIRTKDLIVNQKIIIGS